VNEEVFREIERIRDELIQIDITASHAQHDWNELLIKVTRPI